MRAYKWLCAWISAFLCSIGVIETCAQTGRKTTWAFYTAQHKKLPSSNNASYAIETEFLDSIRAIERVYWAPQKIREVATFSNIRLRRRDGETTVYHDNGVVKRREQYHNGFRQGEGFAYYPDGKLRRHDSYDKQKKLLEQCFDAAGTPINCDTLARREICPNVVLSPGKSAPVYFPAKALKLGMEGVVKIRFIVSRTGQLADVQVVESPSPILSQAAIDALRRVQWAVRLYECDPIDASYSIPFTFQIK